MPYNTTQGVCHVSDGGMPLLRTWELLSLAVDSVRQKQRCLEASEGRPSKADGHQWGPKKPGIRYFPLRTPKTIVV